MLRRGSGTVLRLSGVTLALPPRDYHALASAAQRAGTAAWSDEPDVVGGGRRH